MLGVIEQSVKVLHIINWINLYNWKLKIKVICKISEKPHFWKQNIPYTEKKLNISWTQKWILSIKKHNTSNSTLKINDLSLFEKHQKHNTSNSTLKINDLSLFEKHQKHNTSNSTLKINDLSLFEKHA